MAACNFVKIGAILLATVSAALGIGNITMSVDIPLAHPGDNVTISYVVHNFEIGEFVRLEKMFDDKEPVILSTNHIMEKPFDKIERYSIVLDKEVSNTEDGTYKFIFTLTGIKEEDSGVYQVIGTDTKHKAIATVNVIREAKEIELFFGQPKQEAKVTDGQEFEFEEEQHQGMRCVVSGSNPAADVTVLRGDVDITDQFQRTVSTESTPTEVTGLEIVSHTVTLEAESVLVDYTFSRKPLKCVGKVQGSETALSQSITVKFQGFAPLFECLPNITSWVGQENFNITCKVTASPAVEPDDAYVYWHMMEAQNKPTDPLEKIENGKSYGHYAAMFYREGDQDTIMTLKMERMFPQMAREHFFVAENEFGKAEHSVMIERDESQEVVVAGALRQASLPTLVTLLVALICYVAH